MGVGKNSLGVNAYFVKPCCCLKHSGVGLTVHVCYSLMSAAIYSTVMRTLFGKLVGSLNPILLVSIAYWATG